MEGYLSGVGCVAANLQFCCMQNAAFRRRYIELIPDGSFLPYPIGNLPDRTPVADRA